jgi:hypothetical protein
MSLTVLIFVNLSRQDAHIWALDGEGENQFVATLAPGDTLRQLSAPTQKWNVVTGDNFEFAAGNKNTVYLIGSTGVYHVTGAAPLPTESGAIPADFDFPSYGGGGWP